MITSIRLRSLIGAALLTISCGSQDKLVSSSVASASEAQNAIQETEVLNDDGTSKKEVEIFGHEGESDDQTGN